MVRYDSTILPIVRYRIYFFLGCVFVSPEPNSATQQPRILYLVLVGLFTSVPMIFMSPERPEPVAGQPNQSEP